MNSSISVALTTDPAQHARLQALQLAFAKVCNALAPMVQQSKCWNRVALHHMAYKALRQQFPDLGSQMVCNAIYSVSRSCRLVYQHPKSPFNLQRLAGKPLPTVYFLPQSPVYFDRHTLSLKDGQVSLFTLDGRMRFQIALPPDAETRFRTEKLREVVLHSKANQFNLNFLFADVVTPDPLGATAANADAGDMSHSVIATAPASGRVHNLTPNMPEYILILDDQSPVPTLPANTSTTERVAS
jgi:hypothetical protein